MVMRVPHQERINGLDLIMLSFEKYEGAGNDFIVVDALEHPELLDLCKRNASHLCDRHFGIGADGILVITKNLENSTGNDLNHKNSAENDVDAAMHVINSDGSIAKMCGNGIRCAAAFLLRRYFGGHGEQCAEHKAGNSVYRSVYRIDTLGGLQTVSCLSADEFEVRIARAKLLTRCKIEQNGRSWSGLQVDVGNPHAVFIVQESPMQALNEAGGFLSHHETFPDGCNIEFIRPLGPEKLEVTIYERGVGPTLACGTGCIAAAVAWASESGLARTTVELCVPGGILFVRIEDNDVYLRGPARFVYSGAVPPAVCS